MYGEGAKSPAAHPTGQHGNDNRRSGADGLSDRLFIVAVAIKGLDGLFEIVGAFILSLVRQSMLNTAVAVLTEHELAGSRGDILFHVLRIWFADLTPGKLRFAAAYLFIHGSIKAFLAISLLARRPWSYPLGSAFLAIFIAYTLYRMSLAWSWVLFGFVVLDAVTLVLVLREWAMVRRNRKAPRLADA